MGSHAGRAAADGTSPTVDAVVSYAREVAQLPPFPLEPWLKWLQERDPIDIPTAPTLLKLITTDPVPGEVLPRTSDVWLALMPFQDLAKSVDPATKQDLVQKRRALVSLLATLATSSSPQVRWEATSMHCGESAGPPQRFAKQSFWIDLLRALCPESGRDYSEELTRHLIALSHTRPPRFLLCITHDVTSSDVAELLDQFLQGDMAVETSSVHTVLAACGLSSEPDRRVSVEVGLSVSKGKISHGFLSKLLDTIEQNNASSRTRKTGVQLHVTTVRFGPNCSFQAKAMELLGQRNTSPHSVQRLRLGILGDLKPASLRTGLSGLLHSQRRLRHLSVATFDRFKAVASMLRNGDTSVEELDIAYEPTIEGAVWLAFGLFHVDSRSRVSSLRLRLPRIRAHPTCTDLLTAEWLSAFTRVLQSTTADRDLADMDGESESQQEAQNDGGNRRFVTIRAGTAVKSDPYGGAKLLCKVDSETETFEVIAAVDKSLAVVVTGLGVGWVPTASTLPQPPVPSRLNNSSSSTGVVPVNRTVKSLVWDSTTLPCNSRANGWDAHRFNVHISTLLSFLAVVGEPLERLQVPLLPLSTYRLGQILSYCPNLVELNVSGHNMTSIAPLRDAYARGDCHITRLSISRSDVWFLPGDTTLEMNDILLGPGGRTLRQLAVQVLPPHWNTTRGLTYMDQEVLPFLDTVSKSSTLEFVQLPGAGQCVGAVSVDDQGVPAYEPMCRLPIDVAAQPFCVSKMPLQNKLAFVSTLSDTHSARSRLDASVVALVFQFADATIARRVVMHASLSLERCDCCYWTPHRAMANDLPRFAW